ncbi:MAG: hypothetical protein WBI14_00065, partial [Anaerolineaceae bacterium]
VRLYECQPRAERRSPRVIRGEPPCVIQSTQCEGSGLLKTNYQILYYVRNDTCPILGGHGRE